MSEQVPASPRAAAKVPPVSTPGTAELLMLAVFVVVVTGLYFAREVMVPITLAVLLSFLLAPLVNVLRRIHVPRVPAALLSVALSVGVIVALAGMIGMQIADLASDLPRYQYTIERKAAVLQRVTVGQLTSLIDRIGHQATLPPQPAPKSAPSSAPAPPKPVPVQIQEPPPSPLAIAREVLTPVVAPLATSAIVFVVAIFILLQQEDLRDRLIRLFGSNDLHRTTLALDDAGRRLSRYFLTQLAINTGFGCVITGGLLVIGVPSPLLWGILGALLRFVPYVGTWISAIIPLALASAVDPGWSMVVSTIALYTIVELITGQIIEPIMYGHSTGLSSVSVVVAAIFWSWLWGPIGLILSTPLTLCLVVLGRHVPRLEFLDVLLGDRPALTPVESFYQRILAGDADEALAQAELLLRERPLSTYYDEVVLNGLRLATVDVDRGLLQPVRRAEVVKTVLELVGDLDGHDDVIPKAKDSADGPIALPERETAVPLRTPAGPDMSAEQTTNCAPVLCIAGRGPFDDTAAAMLAQLLTKHGLEAQTLPHAAVSRSHVGQLRIDRALMICLCHVEVSGDPARLRYQIRRIRQQVPGTPILVGLWPGIADAPHDERLASAISADHLSSTLTGTVNICLREARRPATRATPQLLTA